MRVYLDNAATTPMRPEVVDAMVPFMREYFGNPSSIHAEGRKVRAAIEAARKTVAEAIGASIGEIFFTSGGTESNNMSIKCAVRDLGVERIISSPVEHHAVTHAIDCVSRNSGVEAVYLDVDALGRPDLTQLRNVLAASEVKTMVSLMHANNEIGTINDMQAISDICQEFGAYLHTDSVQTIGHYPIDINNTKVSFLSGAAHKFHGPKGVGFVYINSDNIVSPFIDGGGQERNMRAGTENVYGIVGLAKALQLMLDNLEAEVAHIKSLKDRMRTGLIEAVPGITFNGDIDGSSLYTVLSASFPPSVKNEMLLLALDIAGVSCSSGSACSSGAEAGSHVLQAIGHDPDRKSVRFSFSKYNTPEEIDFVVEEIRKVFPVESAVAG